MQGTTLIDTSSWIEALRVAGNSLVRKRVEKLMLDGNAAWCDMISLELWNGAKGESERKMLKELENEITMLPTTSEVWMLAKSLAQKCRKSGKTIPSTDLLIVSCGLLNEVAFEYQDKHFDAILKIHYRK